MILGLCRKSVLAPFAGEAILIMEFADICSYRKTDRLDSEENND